MEFELKDLITLENIIEEHSKSENWSAAVHIELLDVYYKKAREMGLLEE